MVHEWDRALQRAISSRYRFIRRLGEGGTSIVFLATDTKHERPVAIKVLRPENAGSIAASRFEREIGLVARLTHPNILALLDSGEANGVPYFVTPFIAGESLSGRLARERRLPIPEALRITQEVADALDYAHAAGVIHRDIKPGNILLLGRHAIVADFGAGWVLRAGQQESSTATGVIVGTMEYMSPEQAAGEREIDGRSDEYSLALVVYEMLAGSLPFSGMNARAIMAQRFTTHPPPFRVANPDVSERVEQAVLRGLAADPEERFPRILDFALALSEDGSVADPGSLRTQAFAFATASSAERLRSDRTSSPITSRFSEVDRRSIAVLPFMPVSSNDEDGFLAYGIAEETSIALARVRSLHVVGGLSHAQREQLPSDVREIGKRLGVRFILDGSIRRAGELIRVSWRFVDTSDGRQLWADQLDRPFDDLFSVEAEIAATVVERLEIQLLGQLQEALFERPSVRSPAHEVYLRARYAWSRRSETQLERSVRLFEESTKLDQSFAPAHAGLASSYFSLYVYGARSPREVIPPSKAAASRALEIDSTLADAHAVEGAILATHDWQWSAAEDQFERAIALDPLNAICYHWYAVNVLSPLGRDSEALHAIRRAQSIEPLSAVLAASEAIVHFAAHRYGESIVECERALELEPNFGLTHFFRGQALVQLEQYDRARSAYQRAIDLSGRSPELLAGLAHLTAIDGDKAEARQLLVELMNAAHARYVSPYLIGQVHLGLGDYEQAISWLCRAVHVRAAELSWIGVREIWNPLRRDDRFEQIERSVGG
jgi:serine/threonine-protein kinase